MNDNVLTSQELIGLSLQAKRQAHAVQNGVSEEESRRIMPLSKLLDDPLFVLDDPLLARFGHDRLLNGNGTSVVNNG